MSPEQLQGKPADPRSDIFSLGLVLYEMLTGKRAVSAEDPASVISEIMLGSAPQVDTSSLQFPAALGGLVQRCLAKKPEDRWQSARDIQWVLEEIRSAPETTLGGCGCAFSRPFAEAVPDASSRSSMPGYSVECCCLAREGGGG